MAIVDNGSVIVTCGSVGIKCGDGLVVSSEKRRDVVLMYHQIIGRDAGLPSIGELTIGDSRGSISNRVALLHDHRRLATEFQRHRHKVFAGGSHHRATDPRASGEEHMIERKSRK